MDKRTIRREFKERTSPKGVFSFRCLTTGETWVGGSSHLDTERNSLVFQLKAGLHMKPRLQQAWRTHGEDAFAFEILEQIEEDVPSIGLKDLLRDCAEHWRSRLEAEKL